MFPDDNSSFSDRFYSDTPRKNKRKSPTRREKERDTREGKNNFVRNDEPKPLILKTENQKRYYRELELKDQVFAFGPSGTGKTFVAVSFAVELFLRGKIKKIVITRPIIGVGKSLGALPGTKDEKMMEWVREISIIMKDRMGTEKFEKALQYGNIEIASLEHIRGRSFSNSFVFMTESQNADVETMKALVTRIGEGSKLVIDGDVRQTDLKGGNGMLWALDTISENRTLRDMSGIVEFSVNDVVRSGLCAAWVRAIWGDR